MITGQVSTDLDYLAARLWTAHSITMPRDSAAITTPVLIVFVRSHSYALSAGRRLRPDVILQIGGFVPVNAREKLGSPMAAVNNRLDAGSSKRNTASRSTSMRSCVKARVVHVRSVAGPIRLAGSVSSDLTIGFTSTTTMKRARSAGCFVRTAIRHSVYSVRILSTQHERPITCPRNPLP